MDWRETYRDKIVASPAEAVKIIESGDFVVAQQVHSENKLMLKALADRAEELRDVRLMCHLQMGPADYAEDRCRGHIKGCSNFLGPTTRPYFKRGHIDYLPLYFVEMVDYYQRIDPPDVFFLMVPPPDENGVCSYGLNGDYSITCAQRCKKLIVQINRNLPFTYGATLSLDRAAVIVEAEEQIIESPPTVPTEKELSMAALIAPLVPDGACLQLGVGGVPDAVLAMLHDKKDLGIHTELFSDGVVDLYRSGAITNRKKRVHRGKLLTNFVMGTQKVFDFVDHNPDVLLTGVYESNDPYIIAKNDNVVSINSCLQVDLLGQVASDTLLGSQYSGVGGQMDFVRGARMSKGGKSILVLRSTAKGDTVSNVVCFLERGTAVTVPRHDVQYICTEYGIVNLYGKTNWQRAEALISIAHPKFREQLRREAVEAHLLWPEQSDTDAAT